MLTTREGSTQKRAGWIIAAIAFAIPLSLFAVRDLQIRPETSLRLADDDPIRRLAAEQREDLARPQSLLATWDGSTCDDPRTAPFAEALLGQIDADGIRRGGAPEVAAVTTPREMLARLTSQDIGDDESLQRLTGTFIGRGGLKIALTDAGRESQRATTERLAQTVREKLNIELHTSDAVESWSSSESAEDVGPQPNIDEHDLQITWDGFHPQSPNAAQVRALTLALTDFSTEAEPDGRKLVKDCFLAPGSPIGIRIDLSDAGVADVSAAVAAIDRAAVAANIPKLHVVGDPLIGAEQLTARRHAAWNASAPAWRLSQRSLPLLAALVAAALACFVLRSIRRGAALMAATATVAVLGVALLRPLGPQLDTLLLAAPLLGGLLVLAGGMGIAHDRLRADATAVNLQPFRLATIIVAIVLSPLMISSTPVVRQLGMFGTVCAGLALLLGTLLLPALLPQVVGEQRSFRGANERWAALAGFVTDRHRLLGALCGTLLIAGAAGVSRLGLETNDVRTYVYDSRLAADTKFVEDNLAGTSALDVIVRFDAASEGGTRFLERAEIVRAAEQAVRRHSAVTGAISLADLLPETAAPPPNAPTRTRVMFNRRSNDVERQVQAGAIPGAETLLFVTSADSERPVAADETPDSPATERWRISAQVLLPAGASVLQVTDDLNASIQRVLRDHPGAQHQIAGDAVFADGARRVVLRSLSKTSILACVALIGALIWLLRSPAAALVGILINGLPIVAVLGVAAIKGLRFNEEVLAVALLGLVICAHSTIQFLVRFRDSIQQGKSHTVAARRALCQSGPASVRFALVAVAALLVIGRSELAELGRAGRLLAGMIAATQLTTLVLLPSLLAGRVGRWFERSLRLPPSANSNGVAEETPSPHVRFEPATRDAVHSTV